MKSFPFSREASKRFAGFLFFFRVTAVLDWFSSDTMGLGSCDRSRTVRLRSLEWERFTADLMAVSKASAMVSVECFAPFSALFFTAKIIVKIVRIPGTRCANCCPWRALEIGRGPRPISSGGGGFCGVGKKLKAGGLGAPKPPWAKAA